MAAAKGLHQMSLYIRVGVGGGAWSMFRVSLPKLKCQSGLRAISRASVESLAFRVSMWEVEMAFSRIMIPSR